MIEKKIVVPEGMSKAVDIALRRSVDNYQSIGRSEAVSVSLEAALRWLAENPIVPTEVDVMGILQERVQSGHISGREYISIPAATVRFVIREWQRRIFLAPEPEIPDEIEDLLDDGSGKNMDDSVLEAFKRGQKAGSR